jgi:hypothetical protein
MASVRYPDVSQIPLVVFFYEDEVLRILYFFTEPNLFVPEMSMK